MSNAIDELKAQIATKESEHNRVKEELDVLRRALAIISGRRMDESGGRGSMAAQKIPDMIREVLGEHPLESLSADELVSQVKAKGCQATRQTILGAAYRLAKESRGVKLVDKGSFKRLSSSDEALELIGEISSANRNRMLA
jgi:hypothetical protein